MREVTELLHLHICDMLSQNEAEVGQYVVVISNCFVRVWIGKSSHGGECVLVVIGTAINANQC